MKQPIVICGPTAVGKTDFALSIAPIVNGEIISADSRQIYQGMDIGTGKDIPEDSVFHLKKSYGINGTNCSVGYYPVKNSKIWLTDVIDPSQRFGSGIYSQLASDVITNLIQQHITPIIVGGTGFYINSIINPSEFQNVPPNEAVRQDLSTRSLSELQRQLQSINLHRWNAMNHSDQNNSRRLIRAIEISLSPNYPTTELPNYQTISLGLTAPVDVLIDRIKARVIKRVQQGFTEEITTLTKRYPFFADNPGGRTIGYQEWIQHLAGSISQDEAITRWTEREINYMKRQLTWFKKIPHVTWFDITTKNWYAEAVNQLNNWI